MILFTNGCSWTYGGGLGLDHKPKEERLVKVWPHHLGMMLGSDETINLSYGGGSNSRILRTTFDWIQEQTPDVLDKTIAVIQWTEYSRYEYYVPSDSMPEYEQDPHRWAWATVNHLWSPEHDLVKAKSRIRTRLETYSNVEGMYKHIAECDALGFLFKTHNIKYYYWNYNNIINSYPDVMKNYLLSNHVWLDNGSGNWYYERIGPQDAHPGLTGHKQLAEIIYNKMKEKQ